jgi:hypothetical protein
VGDAVEVEEAVVELLVDESEDDDEEETGSRLTHAPSHPLMSGLRVTNWHRWSGSHSEPSLQIVRSGKRSQAGRVS